MEYMKMLSGKRAGFRTVTQSFLGQYGLVPAGKRRNRISTLGLFLTRRCNLRCIYCCLQVGEDPPDKLTLGEIQSAIRQAVDAGARRIVIPGEGEPFLDENLFSIIDFAVSLGMKVKIFTNGLLIDRLTAQHLFRTGVSIIMKLHAIDADAYDRLAGKGHAAEWEQYACMPAGMETVKIPGNLKYLLEAGYMRSRRFPWGESPLQIESVITSQNIDQLPGLARCCKHWNIDFMAETIIRSGKAAANFHKLRITRKREEALLKELKNILGWKLGVRQRIRCTFETNPFLDVSGNIRHCFGLAADIGNIRDLHLAELHRREIAARMERGLISAPFYFGNKGFRYCATRRAHDELSDSR